MRVNHVGYLVKDIDKSISIFQQLGYEKISEVFTEDKAQGNEKPRNVYICFMKNEGSCVELVSPIDESSDVFSTLKRQGEGPYHICYEVENLKDAVNSLTKEGWLVLKRPTSAIAFDGAEVVSLFRNNIGMIELVEINDMLSVIAL